MAKIIGIIRSTKDKKVFFLPSDIKKIIEKGYQIFCHKNYGHDIGISDQEYINNGAKILNSRNDVIIQSEVILITSNIARLKKNSFRNKIVISLSNFLSNVPMLECFIHQNTTAIQWLFSNNKAHFDLFNNLETIKNKYFLELLPKTKMIIKNIALINDTFASFKLAQYLLQNNYNIKMFINKNYFFLSSQAKQLQQIWNDRHWSWNILQSFTRYWLYMQF